uniref:Superoxide dismutase copper/zinc binding domain-containing protein n=1 Tax=Paramormyrops kingsleyae TaxID=1676925 RepID=A0A3B3TB89_9TELE
MEEKVVHALIDMKGTKGTFTFSQVSPFDVTEVRVNLMNTKNLTRTYHVHQFPMPESRSTEEDVCSHDNVGDHWNPHKVTVSDPAYPHGPGATHDMYEVGDLSGRHGSLDNISDVEQFFSDWNLPLFGTNSIVGRSVVIHQSNGARLLCGTIGYPGEVTEVSWSIHSHRTGEDIQECSDVGDQFNPFNISSEVSCFPFL